ncbi:preprotein translocase subunit SecE [Antrihabitans cavernicola]|uniref:Protein translocase subunit SecE n=1 Tax=Antrihabitans cavernicola TaxID=2495913 RepID=A0A5A7S643_9NOCA|nr:preprotein translocase subunit SecE [Spelaeibacter cavernicola]KAA0020195.1 preprotein translocase subunit SecE [Spelaeibacter cavernicola]
MSDERDTRDDGSSEENTSRAADSASDSSVSRPTGKRSTRRARAGADGDSTAAPSTRGAVATKSRPTPKRAEATAPKKENIFKRLRRFFREVIAELRKVIWPNRKQMVTYTSVVLVFVIFMVAFISGLDLAFIKGVSWLFG